MRINIWIKTESIDELAHFLSDDFSWDRTPVIEQWTTKPKDHIQNFIQVSLTYDQFKKLEDLL